MRTSLNIAELKSLVLGTADLREASFLSGRYRLDLVEAARLACRYLAIDPGFAPAASLLLSDATWNDALFWAGDCQGREPLRLGPGFRFPERQPVKE